MLATALLSSCAPTPGPVASPPAAAAAVAVVPTTAASTAEATAAPGPELASLPVLAAAVPADATIVVHLPSVDHVRTLIGQGLMDQAVSAVASALRGALGVPETLGRDLLGSFDGAVLFSRAAGADPASALLGSGVVLRFRDPAPVDRLLESSTLQRSGSADWVDPGREAEPSLRARWSPRAAVLALAFHRDVVEAAWQAATGSAPSFASGDAMPETRRGEIWIWSDLHRLSRGEADAYEPGSRLLVALGEQQSAGGFAADLDLVQNGSFVPRVGSLFVPPERSVIGRLPSGASVALALTTKRRQGVGFGDILGELGRARSAPGLRVVAVAMLGRLGLTLETLEQSIGDELALALYLPDATVKRPMPSQAEGRAGASGARAAIDLDEVTVCGALESPDRGSADALLAALATWLRREAGPVRASAGRIVMTPRPGTAVRIEARASMIAFAAGNAAQVNRLFARLDRPNETLDGSTPFAQARRAPPAPAHVWLYADYDALARAGLLDVDPDLRGRLRGRSAVATASYLDSPNGMQVRAHTPSGAELVGVLGALAVPAFQRYLATAKAAQARALIAAVTRSAVAAYEREPARPGDPPARTLCASALPVPPQVPRGKPEPPSSAPGEGFRSGGPLGGWTCLRSSFDEPLYYQLEYRAGGPYKGPSRGGPDPGPRGFEVSAEGDLDADGRTSLFTMTGRVDPSTGRIVLLEPFDDDPLE